MTQGRYIPTHVRRQLRREAYFGCAECGSPILEYHHIVPFAEEKHNNPEHMIALCPTHHTSLGKMHRNKCYALKENPYNKRKNIIKGVLGNDVEVSKLKVGNCLFINTPIVFEYYNKSLISYRFEDGQFLLSVHLPGKNFWADLLIKDNDVIIKNENLLDIIFQTNYMKIVRSAGSYIEVDIRKDTAIISAEFYIGNEKYEFTPSKTNIDGLMYKITATDCGGGIFIGHGKTTIHWPNYAMANPRVIYTNS